MSMGYGFGFTRARRASSGGGAPSLNQNVRVLFIGDSTTAGVGADPSGVTDYVGSRPYSVPLVARDWLTANGAPSTAETVTGDNNMGLSSWTNYRPDITVVGAVGTSSRSPTLGRLMVRPGSGTSVAFTTSIPVDTIEFAAPRVSGYGVLRLSVDGVQHSTYDGNQAVEDYFKSTVTGLSLATHEFKFNSFSGTASGPGYIIAWNSAVKTVQILNAGVRNHQTADWIVATWPASALNAIDTIAPNIAVIDIGINDWRQSGTTIATCQANIQTVITRCISAGAAKVILVVPNAIQAYSVVTDAWSQAAVLTMYQALAAANPSTTTLINAPALYFAAGLGAANPATYTSLNSAGYMYDTFHPKAAVYAVEGEAVGDAIKTICTAQGWLA